MTKKKPSAKAIEMTDSFRDIWTNQKENLITIYLARLVFKYYGYDIYLFGLLLISLTLTYTVLLVTSLHNYPILIYTVMFSFVLMTYMKENFISNVLLRLLFKNIVTIKGSGERQDFLIGFQRPFEKMYQIKLYKESGYFYCNSEEIIGVTFKHVSGLIFYLEKPMRHHNVLWAGINIGANKQLQINSEQGFLTNFGRYVNRKEGKIIAVKAEQLLPRHSKTDNLFSECVWETPKGE